jgi:hypothetical protein
MIDTDTVVGQNYGRLVGQTIEYLFLDANKNESVSRVREAIIGEVRKHFQEIYPDLILESLSNPVETPTFTFRKGKSTSFLYKNLSAGEKAVFDLILDLILKRREFDNTVYVIDEPEAHLNSRVQKTFLEQIFQIIPANCQLWVATHSIGMLNAARKIKMESPHLVEFLDFTDRNFDFQESILPTLPSGSFWETALRVAMDDISGLVIPEIIVVCEGANAAEASIDRANFDAECYQRIFDNECMSVKFISGGSSSQVVSDYRRILDVVGIISKSSKIIRLIDGDKRSDEEKMEYKSRDICVLPRRSIEAYLFSANVVSKYLASINVSHNLIDVAQLIINCKNELKNQNQDANDWKLIGQRIFANLSRQEFSSQLGGSWQAFAKHKLSPMLTPDLAEYNELKKAIFG